MVDENRNLFTPETAAPGTGLPAPVDLPGAMDPPGVTATPLPDDDDIEAGPIPRDYSRDIDLRPVTRTPLPEFEAKQKAAKDLDEASDVWSAGLASQNPIYNEIWYGGDEDVDEVKGYNPYIDDADLVKDYDLDIFSRSRSPGETLQMVRRIKAQRKDQALLARHPVASFFSQTGGAVLNPLLWPAMVVAPESIGAAVALEVAGESVSELILHQQMPERTLLESGINITAAGAFTAVVGVLAKRMAPGEMESANDALADFFDAPRQTRGTQGAAEVVHGPSKSDDKSAGAMEADATEDG